MWPVIVVPQRHQDDKRQADRKVDNRSGAHRQGRAQCPFLLPKSGARILSRYSEYFVHARWKHMDAPATNTARIPHTILGRLVLGRRVPNTLTTIQMPNTTPG